MQGRGDTMGTDPRLARIRVFLKESTGSRWEDLWVVETAENLVSILHNQAVLASVVMKITESSVMPSSASFPELVQSIIDTCTSIGVPANHLFSQRDVSAGSATTRQAFERVVYCLHELAVRYSSKNGKDTRQFVGGNPHLVGSVQSPAKPLFRHSSSNNSASHANPASGKKVADSSVPAGATASVPSKGLLELLLGDDFSTLPPTSSPNLMSRMQSDDKPGGGNTRGDPSNAMFQRAREDMDAIARVIDSPQQLGPNDETLRSTLTQASVARVQEKIALNYKRKCQELETRNKELLDKLSGLEQNLEDKTKEQTALTESLSNIEAQKVELQSNHQFWLSELSKLETFLGIAAEQNSLEDSKASIRLLTNHAIELKKSVENMFEFGVRGFRNRAESNSSTRERVTTLSDDDEDDQVLSSAIENGSTCIPSSTTVNSTSSSFLTKLPAIQQEIKLLKDALRDTCQQTKAEMSGIGKAILDMSSTWDQKLGRMTMLYQKEATRRKQLLNQVHHLKGNIRVMCRIRPRLPHEENAPNNDVVIRRLSSEKVVVVSSARNQQNHGIPVSRHRRNSMAPRGSGSQSQQSDSAVGQKEYEFDQVFGPESTQAEVFEEVRPLVESVLDGYSSSIFAYGQTGSGKTFTMSGSPHGENQGVNYRALSDLFDLINRRSAVKFTYKISISIVEIYNEQVRDLIAPTNSASKCRDNLTIREGAEGIFIPDCTVTQVTTVDQVWDVMNHSQENRVSASTNMNDKSSRSHSVVMISVDGLHVPSGNRTRGKLILVDLAGSERLDKSGVIEQQKKEAQHINKSLSSLGDVIAALTNPKAAHVPFRNSKLTYLLKDALGKDNKALMVIQVSPVLSNAQESNCSMQFGARVRTVRLGRPQRKEESGLTARIEAQLRKAEGAITSRDVEIAALKEQVDDLRNNHEKAVSQLRQTTGALQSISEVEVGLQTQLETVKATARQREQELQETIKQLQSENHKQLGSEKQSFMQQLEAQKQEFANRLSAQKEAFMKQLDATKQEMQGNTKTALESSHAQLEEKHELEKIAYNRTIQELESKLLNVRRELEAKCKIVDEVQQSKQSNDTLEKELMESLEVKYANMYAEKSLVFNKQIASLEAKLTSSKMELNSRKRRQQEAEKSTTTMEQLKSQFEEEKRQWELEQVAQASAYNKRIATLEAKLQSAKLEIMTSRKTPKKEKLLAPQSYPEELNVSNVVEGSFESRSPSPNENVASVGNRFNDNSTPSDSAKQRKPLVVRENELPMDVSPASSTKSTSRRQEFREKKKSSVLDPTKSSEGRAALGTTQRQKSAATRPSIRRRASGVMPKSSLRGTSVYSPHATPRAQYTTKKMRQVTWKNTPQMISPAHSVAGTPDVENVPRRPRIREENSHSNQSSTAFVDGTTQVSSNSRPTNDQVQQTSSSTTTRTKEHSNQEQDIMHAESDNQHALRAAQQQHAKITLGGASRILQPTPGRSNVRAPRRIPTSSRRPKWKGSY